MLIDSPQRERHASVAAICFTIVTLLAQSGCGGGGGSDTSSGPPPPPPPASTTVVSGTVEGLPNSSSFTLHVQGVGRQSITGNGPFSFTAQGQDGTPYFTQPLDSDRHCTVANGSGELGISNRTVQVRCERGKPWVTNGPVRLAALSDDESLLFLAGDFSRIGPATGNFAVVDLATGVPLPPRTPLTGAVNAVVSDGNGGHYVAEARPQGALAPDAPFARIRHVLPDGSLDSSFAPQFDGSVDALARIGGQLYVAGRFSEVKRFRSASDNIGERVQRAGLAALDLATGVVLPWSPAVVGVEQILAVEGQLILAGRLTRASGDLAEGCLVAADAQTGVLTALIPSAAGCSSGPMAFDGSRVAAVVAQSSLSIAAGTVRVEAVAWPSRERRLLMDSLQTTGVLAALAIVDGAVVVGGQFVDELAWRDVHVWRVDESRRVLEPLNWPLPDSWLQATYISQVGRKVLLTNWQTTPSLVVIDLDRLAALDWPATLAGGSMRLASVASDGRVWLAGAPGMMGGVLRPGLAAVDTRTGQATAWNPNQGCPSFGGVQALVSRGGVVAIAGRHCVGSEWREGVRLVDAITGNAVPLDLTVPAGNGVAALALQGSTLLMGGRFNSIGGQARHNLAAVDLTRLALLPWSPTAPGADLLTAAQGVLYLAGLDGWAAYDVASLQSSPLWELPAPGGAFGRVLPRIFTAIERGVVISGAVGTHNLDVIASRSGQRSVLTTVADLADRYMACGNGLMGLRGEPTSIPVPWNLDSLWRTTLGSSARSDLFASVNGTVAMVLCASDTTYLVGDFTEWYPASRLGAFPQSGHYAAWLTRWP